MDMQFISMDIAEKNYVAAGLDTVGLLLPGVTGAGNAADSILSKLYSWVKGGNRNIAEVIRTIDNGKVVMCYKTLKVIAKGMGLEVHHLLEKRFLGNPYFKKLGLKDSDVLSVAISKEMHQQITQKIRAIIGYSNQNMPVTTFIATPQQIWDALKSVYTDIGRAEWLEMIKPYFENLNVKFD